MTPTRCWHSVRSRRSALSCAEIATRSRQRAKMRAISGPAIASNASYSRRSARSPRLVERVQPVNTTAAPHSSDCTRACTRACARAGSSAKIQSLIGGASGRATTVGGVEPLRRACATSSSARRSRPATTWWRSSPARGSLHASRAQPRRLQLISPGKLSTRLARRDTGWPTLGGHHFSAGGSGAHHGAS